jgi:CPA1 family monovalent cation:H+ antiporter
MLSIFEISALLFLLSALFGWLNLKVFKLPHTIGLLIMALGSSLVLLAVHAVLPNLGITERLSSAISQIDFHSTIMDGMLAFLLFAGALHVDFNLLRGQKWAIGLLATVGVLISMTVIAFGFYGLARLFGLELPIAWAFVLGALISPTDPVAVLGLLKTVKVPEAIKAKIAGEALFNDGVAVVAFSVALVFAVTVQERSISGDEFDLWAIAVELVYQVVGGGALGLIGGFIAYRGMAMIDDRTVEILISLAACVATYAIAHRLHMSGPIAVVAAGLLIGNRGAAIAMSENVRDYLFAFWEVVDEILNSVLFLLIGLEVLIFSFDLSAGMLALASIPLALAARFISVYLPIKFLSLRQSFPSGSISVLTWGGLRGGVSVALALSLPDSEFKPALLAAAYAVVVFTIIVQGLTIQRVISRTVLENV